MVITVTQADILNSNDTPHGNPIALAVQRQTKAKDVRCEFTQLSHEGKRRYSLCVVFPRTFNEHRILVPPEVEKWYSAYQNDVHSTSPIQFEIDYTYRTAGEEYLHRMAMRKLQKKKSFS